MKNLKLMGAIVVFLLCGSSLSAETIPVNYSLSLKRPGNPAISYPLHAEANALRADQSLPLTIRQEQTTDGGDVRLTVTLTATERVYFNLAASLPTTFQTDDCDFYLPGFWYHQNLRSPREAPSFHTSKSWNFREDRLSSPLTGVFDSTSGQSLTIMRLLDESAEALTTHQEGEVILGGKTSLGYLGFDGETGHVALTFGYPYVETPKRYIRKLTLAPAITTFAKLEKGETLTLKWLVHQGEAQDYGQFVAQTWQQCMDRLAPQPIHPLYTPQEMKAQLANYFRKGYVDKYPLKYHSGISIRCDDCQPIDHVQLGFCGRVLLNAFNALEYGEQTGDRELVRMGQEIFESEDYPEGTGDQRRGEYERRAV